MCDFYEYADAVEGFSRRKLSIVGDAFWAFRGVTRSFQNRFPEGFIWGLPAENLDVSLL
jgi:hypothetical protein